MSQEAREQALKALHRAMDLRSHTREQLRRLITDDLDGHSERFREVYKQCNNEPELLIVRTEMERLLSRVR